MTDECQLRKICFEKIFWECGLSTTLFTTSMPQGERANNHIIPPTLSTWAYVKRLGFPIPFTIYSVH